MPMLWGGAKVPNQAAPPSGGASRWGAEPAGMRNRVAWGWVD
jgi:hypothetical protein